MTIIPTIMVFGIVLGLFLGILLLSLNNSNKKANRFLGYIMIVSSLVVSGFGFTKFGLYYEMPHLLGVASTMIFLLGPLFYFYVKTLTQRDFTISTKMYIHFLPFMLLNIYLTPFYFQNSSDKMVEYFSSSFSLEHRIIISIQILHAFIYMLYVKHIIKQHVKEIKNSLSSIEKLNLNWMKTGINIFAFIISSVAFFIVLLFLDFKVHPVYSQFIPVAISATILGLGFVGLKQPIIFPPEKVIPQFKKYEKSTLTDEIANRYLKELKHFMKEEKPYLQSDLTLQKLAENLRISHHHLSQLINEKLNQNFFDFVNSYRVEDAKELLVSEQGNFLTILAIAEKAGFNSKSSFNAVFKKQTGKTPTQFKQEVLQKN